MAEGNKPLHKLRQGQISLTIWENSKKVDDAERKWNSFNLEKSYKDGEEWKNTQNFTSDDLLKICALVLKANELLNIN
jgi:hypothetical protein